MKLWSLYLMMCNELNFWYKWEHWDWNLGSLLKLHPTLTTWAKLEWQCVIGYINIWLELIICNFLISHIAILIICFGAAVGITTYYEHVSEYLAHIFKCSIVNIPIIAGDWNRSAVPIPIASNCGACRG